MVLKISRNEQFLKDKKTTYENAVLRDDWDGVVKYCKKYGVPILSDERILKAGIYKGTVAATDISAEVKSVAMTKCLALGFSPFIK